MGNDQSKGSEEAKKYGGIYYKLDKEVLNPGDTVTGNVYLDLKSPYPGDKLCFEIKGEEYTKWIDREARTRNRPDGTVETYYVNVTREGKHEIIKQEITIYDWKAGMVIPPGQYTFPVSFLVPKGLPGSFFFTGGATIAEISYKVEAYLKPEKENVPKLKDKKQVVVREKLEKSIETREIKLSKQITTCCCISKGSIDMKTSFEKTAYAPGEEARIITEVDNSKGSLAVSDIYFTLTQHLSLTAGPHHRTFPFTIRTLSLGGIQAGEKCVDNQCKIGSIQLPKGQEGSSKNFRGDTEIPDHSPDPTQIITPSCHGKLVKSDFVLNVTSNLDGCLCCDSMPSNSLPIQIYSAELMPKPDPQPPVNWKPQQMPTANLTITIVQRADGGQDIHIQQGDQPNQNQMVQPSMGMSQPQQPAYNNMQQPQYPQQQPQYPQQQPNPYPQQQYPQQYPPQQHSEQQYPQQYPPQQYPQQMNPQQVNVAQNNY